MNAAAGETRIAKIGIRTVVVLDAVQWMREGRGHVCSENDVVSG